MINHSTHKKNEIVSSSFSKPGADIKKIKSPKAKNLERYEELLKKGVFYKYRKSIYEAIHFLTLAIEINPQGYESYLQKGLTYFSIEEKLIAINYIEEGYKKCYNTMKKHEKLILEGLILELKDNNMDEALKKYKESIKCCIDPKANNDFAYNAIGYIYHINKDYKKAIDYYKRAINSNPKYSSCIMYCNIGLCYEMLGNKEKTLKYYNLSISENEFYLEAYIYRSQYLAKLKQYKKAKSDLLKIISIDPTNSLAHALLGDLFHEKQLNEKKKKIRFSVIKKKKDYNHLAHNQYLKANLFNPKIGSFYEILATWELYKMNPNDPLSLKTHKVIKFIDQGLKNCVLSKDVHSLFQMKIKILDKLYDFSFKTAVFLIIEFLNKNEKIKNHLEELSFDQIRYARFFKSHVLIPLFVLDGSNVTHSSFSFFEGLMIEYFYGNYSSLSKVDFKKIKAIQTSYLKNLKFAKNSIIPELMNEFKNKKQNLTSIDLQRKVNFENYYKVRFKKKLIEQLNFNNSDRYDNLDNTIFDSIESVPTYNTFHSRFEPKSSIQHDLVIICHN